MNNAIRHIAAVLLLATALVSSGCINSGQTIRVSGQIVDTEGLAVPDATLLGLASKRGGLILLPSEFEKPSEQVDAREVVIQQQADGAFTASASWAGTLTLSVEGYKIRRVDELGTVFLVPNQSFYESQDQVRLEVVKHD